MRQAFSYLKQAFILRELLAIGSLITFMSMLAVWRNILVSLSVLP